ncbi:hypothetical protein [Deinococcus altitudinis]|uniref:hypothetical protein n=1 Tax=Deinococcus altitudinis TaxID=468914 RepID=UPI00389172AC
MNKPTEGNKPPSAGKGKQNRNLLMASGTVIATGLLWQQTTTTHSPSSTMTLPAVQQTGNSAPHTSSAPQRFVSDTLGCQDRMRLSVLLGRVSYTAVSKATIKAQTQAAIKAGQCTLFKAGTQVYLNNAPSGYDRVQVHQKGATTLWWVLTGAVR